MEIQYDFQYFALAGDRCDSCDEALPTSNEFAVCGKLEITGSPFSVCLKLCVACLDILAERASRVSKQIKEEVVENVERSGAGRGDLTAVNR